VSGAGPPNQILGISVLTSLQTLQLLGVDAAGLLAGSRLTEAELHALTWVPWGDAAQLFNAMAARLPAEKYGPFASLWLRRHPTLRVAAQFAASTTAWVDLFWRLSGALNPMVECTHSVGAEIRVTARLRPGLAPSPLWFSLLHHQARCAPELLGDVPLRCLSFDAGGYGLIGRYAVPEPTSAAQRVARATDIPLSTIFSALTVLRTDVLEQFRDGHLSFEAARGGGGATRGTFAAHFKLTPTETKVLGLLVDGLVPAELARELNISVGTARVHLKRIYAKTKTAGQRQLLARVEGWTLR
jgi:DNA-binding CsgD family transcriptional regulator